MKYLKGLLLKKLFFLITLYSSLFSINEFKESRYIDSLGITQDKFGNIKIEDDKLIIDYKKPKKVSVIYGKEKLSILNENDDKEYLFEEHPELEYMGILLKSIFAHNYENLGIFFTIKKQGETITLIPKSSISYRIDLIEIINKESKLKKIIFEMKNKDILTIETVN